MMYNICMYVFVCIYIYIYILDWTCRLKSAGNLFASKYYGHIGALDKSNEQMVLGTEQLMTWTHK